MAGGAQDSDDAINGINVTPLVDIMLVLLIIFMVTAKLIVSQSNVPLDLPKAASGRSDIQVVRPRPSRPTSARSSRPTRPCRTGA